MEKIIELILIAIIVAYAVCAILEKLGLFGTEEQREKDEWRHR